MTRANLHLNGWITVFSLWRWLGLSVALLLAACGGGGGDSDTAVVATPVSISQQPVSVAAVVGSSAVFTVSAAGDGLVYQWQVSQDKGTTWTDIPGAVSATYTVQAVTPDLNGYMFRVKVGTGGGLTSSAVTLTATAATAPAAITVQPLAQSTITGGSATFSVTATGTSLSYKWQYSLNSMTWTDIAGATSATLVLGNVTAADNGKNIRVVVSNSLGNVTSAAAQLAVNAATAAPTIATQPISTSVVAPQTASYAVVATGVPDPSYQWQQSIDAGTTFTDIAAATNAAFVTSATTVLDSGKLYRVRVFNSAGSVLSASASLTVSTTVQAPTITTQPTDATAIAPSQTTLSVAASGSPAPNYQWQSSTDGGTTFANINGATSATYRTPILGLADDGTVFRVLVSNSAGTVTSAVAQLTVQALTTTCVPPTVLPTGTITEATYGLMINSNNGSVQPLVRTTVIGPTTFQGQRAVEFDVYSSPTGDVSSGPTTRNFTRYDAGRGTLVGYGALIHQVIPTSNGSTSSSDLTLVFTPASADSRYGLSSGQSVTESSTAVQTGVITVNGVAGAPTVTTTTTTTVIKFDGMEQLTTPAGTFNTCKYEQTEQGGSTTISWVMVGYGVGVKSSSNGSVSTLNSFKVNGTPLLHYP